MDNYIVSARKYRPRSFDTVVGQEALTTTLKNSIQAGRLAHAYLFCGPRGVGKTTCARIFAKTINCLSPGAGGEACGECESCKAFDEQRSFNIYELDAASNNSVDNIRDLVDQVRIPPQVGKYKVFIIDEVHMLSSGAFNAFLKTLEEPPKHAIFILATTEKHKILPTILSRCQTYDFKRMGVDDTIRHLKSVAEREGIKVEDAALGVIAQKADGGMRDALSIFDQVSSFCNGDITYAKTIANLNVLDYDYYFRFTDLFLAGNVTECMLTLDEVLGKGFDGQHFISGLSTHFRNLLMSADAQTARLLDAGEEVKRRYHEQAGKCKPDFLFRAMKLANDCDLNYKQSQNKRLLVEITLIEMAQLSSDDGDPSGLRPTTKTLKPLFTPAEGKANSAQPSAQTGPPASETAPHTIAGEPAHTPYSAVKPESHTATPPPAGARARSFSIRQKTVPAPTASLKDSPPSAGAGQPASPEEHQAKAVTQTDLVVAWRAYAASLPHEEIAMSKQMDNMGPALEEDGQSFTVMADNPYIMNELCKKQPFIEESLRNQLHNRSLRMAVKLREQDERPQTLNRMEQFQALLDESDGLRLLKKKFELELA